MRVIDTLIRPSGDARIPHGPVARHVRTLALLALSSVVAGCLYSDPAALPSAGGGVDDISLLEHRIIIGSYHHLANAVDAGVQSMGVQLSS